MPKKSQLKKNNEKVITENKKKRKLYWKIQKNKGKNLSQTKKNCEIYLTYLNMRRQFFNTLKKSSQQYKIKMERI